MPFIGLDNVHYATRLVAMGTGANAGRPASVTFGTPVKLAEAISANVTPNFATAELYGDDIQTDDISTFTNATFELNLRELTPADLVALFGLRRGSKGEVVYSAEDVSAEVALGFRALKSPGTNYRYYWFKRVKFTLPASAWNTKGDSITFNTPTITGKAMPELIVDGGNKHQWEFHLDDDDTTTGASTQIAAWWTSVPTVTF